MRPLITWLCLAWPLLAISNVLASIEFINDMLWNARQAYMNCILQHSSSSIIGTVVPYECHRHLAQFRRLRMLYDASQHPTTLPSSTPKMPPNLGEHFRETFLEGGGPGSKVIATFYVEAQCPDTTRFVHSQLWPAWQKLYETNRIIWRIIPFGKASCEPQQNNDFSCECQHGHTECELNQLMNCAIQILRHIDQYMPLINCIQGKVNLLDARKECLDGKYETVSSLLDCATGPEGRRLLAEAGEATELLKPRMTFIPWITLNGERSVDAMYDLTENLCNSLIPQPIQCTNDAVDSNLIKPKS